MELDHYDLQRDLIDTDWIVKKIREDKRYAQNLYAAFCNMRWQKLAVLPVLKDQYWSCSWRGAGGIVAGIRGNGEDYMDWYCSGMGGFAAFADEDPEETERYFKERGLVPEGTVTDEIKEDLKKIGWIPCEWPENE